MVAIIVMPAKMTTLGLLNIKIFFKMFMTSQFMFMTSAAKFYLVAQIIL